MKLSMKAARVNAGMTQTELAEKLGVAESTLINWEKGRTTPNVKQLRQFCEIVGMPEDIIFLQ